MTPMEILNMIVDSENDARDIYDEAVSLKNGFEDYVNAHINELRKKYFDEAEKEIAKAEEEEVRLADEKIEELDKKLIRDIEAARARYERVEQDVVLKIFELAVNADA